MIKYERKSETLPYRICDKCKDRNDVFSLPVGQIRVDDYPSMKWEDETVELCRFHLTQFLESVKPQLKEFLESK